jgi:hypothetical protein
VGLNDPKALGCDGGKDRKSVWVEVKDQVGMGACGLGIRVVDLKYDRRCRKL